MSSNSEPVPADNRGVGHHAEHAAGLGLLVRMKLRATTNRLVQAMTDAPVKFLATLACMALVWIGLYGLFRAVFEYLRQSRLESAIAIPMVFNYFFVAMLIMLSVSNAILAYVSLFAAGEASYLLAAPVRARAYVNLKYLETLLFSSWSLVLLGLPLMVAMADMNDEPWFYYPYFIAFFVGFVPIPGAIGLLLAWIMARFLDHRLRKRIVITLSAILVFGVLWTVRGMHVDDERPHLWLNDFLFRVSFLQSALLPSSWVNKGVEAAMQYRTGEAAAYLAVTVSNALFLSWLAVGIVSNRFSVAFDRALSMRGSNPRQATEPAAGIPGLAFCYLPTRMRLIAAKDMRTFLRDPLQWTQLVILFGLMAFYLANLPRFSGAAPLEGWGMIIPFLNFGAISFILATFTSRFVFPLVSLEGRQMWLVGMLPIGSGALLVAKFAFAMTVSVGVAVSTTILASVMLNMPATWAALQIGVTFAVCTGLCGLAVGVGARLPMFGQANAARIANGFGGTVNLVASVMLVLVMLAGMAWLGIRNRHDGFAGPVDGPALGIAAAIAAWGLTNGAVAMTIGARHLRRRET